MIKKDFTSAADLANKFESTHSASPEVRAHIVREGFVALRYSEETPTDIPYILEKKADGIFCPKSSLEALAQSVLGAQPDKAQVVITALGYKVSFHDYSDDYSGRYDVLENTNKLQEIILRVDIGRNGELSFSFRFSDAEYPSFKQLEEILKDSPIVQYSDCPECRSSKSVEEKDQVNPGGAHTTYRTLYSCRNCGYRHRGPDQTVSDY